MAKLELSEHELASLQNALDAAIKSAIRAQNTGKTPQIKEVYKAHEASLKALDAKLANAK